MLLPLICEYCALADTLKAPDPLRHRSEVFRCTRSRSDLKSVKVLHLYETTVNTEGIQSGFIKYKVHLNN